MSGDVDGQHSLQSGVPTDGKVSDRPFPCDGNLGFVACDLTGNLIGGCHGVVLGGNGPDPLTRVEGNESLGTVWKGKGNHVPTLNAQVSQDLSATFSLVEDLCVGDCLPEVVQGSGVGVALRCVLEQVVDRLRWDGDFKGNSGLVVLVRLLSNCFAFSHGSSSSTFTSNNLSISYADSPSSGAS